MEKALRGLGRDGAEGPWSGLLSMPSLGYTREWQEELQQLQQKWLDHGKAMRTYNLVLEEITSKATEILGKKLFGPDGQAAKPPASLREFYNLWVDCGEEAYAEIAAKPEFTEAQAQLVNTLMAVKRHEQKMVDEVLAGLNMPTRRELDTAHRRIHQLQRQLWELKESQADSGVRELREEVAALQRTIESLRAHLEQPAPEKKAPNRAAKATS
jgi:class III poly(R)-hydroxyalkanoic acid synthase PhaE subunit